MSENAINGITEKIQKLLELTKQNWLLGAGISFNANIPLMFPLTSLVEEKLTAESKKCLGLIKNGARKDSHVEHYLSEIGDLIAICSRKDKDTIKLNDTDISKKELNDLYKDIIKNISDLIRYGCDKDSKECGTISKSMLKIDGHQSFVKAVFNLKANLENRCEISFFTTNYDTLLEDALSLEGLEFVDGFTSGGIGSFSPRLFTTSDRRCPKVLKLHGSVDWQKITDDKFFRIRYGVNYIGSSSDILIYPQSTKYEEAQKNPFSQMFHNFRMCLDGENTLVTCGYSFGDDHINWEILSSLKRSDSNTVLIAFVKENEDGLCKFLKDALEANEKIGKRIYVLTDKKIYNSKSSYTKESNVWSFEGLTNFLVTGKI